jgi:hypothetical protein
MLCRAQVITAETSFHAKGFMQSLVIAVLVLGIPSLSLAQADKSSWTNLSALQPACRVGFRSNPLILLLCGPQAINSMLLKKPRC